MVIAHLYCTIEAERIKAEFPRSVAILLTVGKTSPERKKSVSMDLD